MNVRFQVSKFPGPRKVPFSDIVVKFKITFTNGHVGLPLIRNVVTVLTILIIAGPAYAQKETGAIIGDAVTEDELPLPGAMVTASSPTLIGGRSIATTDSDGHYRFPALAPGLYEIKAELSGFQTVIRKEVRLFVGTTLTVNFTLIPQAGMEVVEVSAAGTSFIDVSTAAQSKTVPVETIEHLPKVAFALNLFTLTPGVGDANLEFVAYGAGGAQANAYWFDGVDISNPVTGIPWVFPNYNWIEEVNVIGIGAPAEYGDFTGVITNSVSRSGSDEFHGLFETFYQNDSLTGTNTDIAELSANVDLFSDTTVQIGGPIIHDKLWFFSGFNYFYNRNAPFGYPPDGSDAEVTNTQPKWLNKLTYRYNDNNTLQGFIERDDRTVTGAFADAFTLPEATATEEAPQWFWNASWTSLLKPKMLLDVRTSGFSTEYGYSPRDSTLPAHVDKVTGILSQSYYDIYKTDRYRNQVNVSLSHFAQDFIAGDHDFKFGVQYERSNADRDDRYSGGIFYYDYYGPYYRYLWDGYHTNVTINEVSSFAQDNWKITDKLHLNLGVRWDRNRAKLEDAPIRYSTDKIVPRIGFVYDLKGDQTTVIRAHYGHYAEGVVTLFVDVLDDIGDVLIQYFNPETGAWEDAGFIPGSSFWRIDDHLKQPYTQQFTVGLDKALPAGFNLSAHYIYRRDRDLIEDVDAIGVYEPVPFLNPLTNEKITVFNRLNPGQFSLLITNPDGLFRQYHGVEIYGNKRFSNQLSLSASLVISKVEGNANNTNIGAGGFFTTLTSPNEQINSKGRLTHDPTFEMKLYGIYNLPWGINTGWFFRHFSGDTWTPLVLVTDLNQSPIRIFGLPRGSNRLPGRNVLDIRFEKGFPVVAGEVRFTADIFNVFNTGYALEVEDRVGRGNFGEARRFTLPRQIRLGVRYKF